MKKSFWGYNPPEVDELIEALQNQNTMLKQQVTDLATKLNAANDRLAEAEAALPVSSMLERQTSLEQQLAHAEEDKRKLEAALVETAAKKDTAVTVGQICERAYQDMERMKQDTSRELMQQVDQYAQIIDASNEEIQKTIVQIDTEYEAAVAKLSEFVSYLSDSLETARKSSDNIRKQSAVAQQIPHLLKNKLSGAMAQQAPLEDKAIPEQPSDERIENREELDGALKNLSEKLNDSVQEQDVAKPKEQHKPLPINARTIDIHTNVNSSDILKSRNQ